jgi:uncharacterized protein (DUF362 family)
MDRREFIARVGKATALAAAAGATGILFHDREIDASVAPQVRSTEFEVKPRPDLPVIVGARNEDSVAALTMALTAIGGIERFIAKGDRVTIKPNVGWDRTPEQAANTNPLLVGELVRLCLSQGAREVVVTDVTCNDPRRCFLRSGIREQAESAGAKVFLEAEEDFIDVDLKGRVLRSWPVLKHFVETDKLINVPIVKHHSLSRCTIGMKNLYGIIGGRRHQLHQQIDQSIVDLAAFARPTLTVVDATRVLMRGGPQGGSLDDVKQGQTVICSTDQVAADARGAEFLELDPERVGHIALAQEQGLGTLDYRSLGYEELSA